MSPRKIGKKQSGEGARAVIFTVTALAWAFMTYAWGDPLSSPSPMFTVFLPIALVVMAVLWVQEAWRNRGMPTLTEAGLALAFLAGIFLYYWSDKQSAEMIFFQAVGSLLGLIWFIRFTVFVFTFRRIGGLDLATLLLFVGLSLWFGKSYFLTCLPGKLGLEIMGPLIIMSLFIIAVPLLVLRWLASLFHEWSERGISWPKWGVIVRWMAFPVVLGLIYGLGNMVRPLKLCVYSSNLLAAADKLPEGVSGKLSGFKRRDAPFMRIGGFPVYGIRKHGDTVAFITASNWSGVTTAYVHGPDDKPPVAGKDQAVKKVIRNWWRVAPIYE